MPKPDIFDLDRVTTVIKVEGTLVNETPLRVGSREEFAPGSPVDNPIIRRADGTVYIPGSSLKGVFRSFVEAYSQSAWSSGVHVCYPGVHKWVREKAPKGREAEGCDTVYCREDGVVESVCVPCYIFGWLDTAARLYVLDAPAEGSPAVGTRTMVSINRYFGGQQPGQLYTLDFVEPGARFKFRAFVYNLNFVEGEANDVKAKACQALKALFQALSRDGLFIGARKSIGLGLVRLVDARFDVYKIQGGSLVLSASRGLREVVG
ncbi:CRISPR-associated RAMP protein [Infirmifilum lucidum]|uniref:CRISPR-associated RAMP protein n=1 Tax=Infirmifilum lucidum TaxID=2776706 RepID=A0A7L9FGH1_9CREN|nr:CRISPR-associated RAMP protein Csx7 [Infirmifilum lucidum]QOJ78807.1 CRISPR-associated RAMP protein [Infirmifilum lucidum]